MSTDIPGYLFAGAVAVGGILGYYKKRSVPSLAAGLLFGAALGYGAYEASGDPEKYGVQLAASSVLAAVMGFRFYKSKKVMPAGAVCLLSLAMLLRIAGRATVLGAEPPGVGVTPSLGRFPVQDGHLVLRGFPHLQLRFKSYTRSM
ncbi:hypothetical protein NQ318_005358 [Aromia moschata]|uniref:Transmembrane protein 14C n=1 Tax=Aromia moschata TaxID=1265417 RepID=A0AAV8YYG7_9CUCU|nr:hypothetical protein NQ318_005358 [Aromia moschata]